MISKEIEDYIEKLYPLDRCVTIFRGCPGSGKTTAALSLYDFTRDFLPQVCSADHLFTDLDGEYHYNSKYIHLAHKICFNKYETLVNGGYGVVIVDNTNTTYKEMKDYINLAIQNQYFISIVEPVTEWRLNPDELYKKNIHNVPIETIKKMVNRYESLDSIKSKILTNHPQASFIDLENNVGRGFHIYVDNTRIS